MYRDVNVKESRLMNNIKINLQGLLLLFIKLKEKNISWKLFGARAYSSTDVNRCRVSNCISSYQDSILGFWSIMVRQLVDESIGYSLFPKVGIHRKFYIV